MDRFGVIYLSVGYRMIHSHSQIKSSRKISEQKGRSYFQDLSRHHTDLRILSGKPTHSFKKIILSQGLKVINVGNFSIGQDVGLCSIDRKYCLLFFFLSNLERVAYPP